MWRLTLVLLALALIAGCNKQSTVADETATPLIPVATNSFEDWPDDNLPRADVAGAVERKASSTDGRTLFYTIPDWAEPTDATAYRGASGGTMWFTLRPRSQDMIAEDEARIDKLIRDGNQEYQVLVVARPWRGWYGESSTKNTRIRVYLLFNGKDALEVHTEWPNGNEKAKEECDNMARSIIFSIQALGENENA
jgi:hypothetical protein